MFWAVLGENISAIGDTMKLGKVMKTIIPRLSPKYGFRLNDRTTPWRETGHLHGPFCGSCYEGRNRDQVKEEGGNGITQFHNSIPHCGHVYLHIGGR